MLLMAVNCVLLTYIMNYGGYGFMDLLEKRNVLGLTTPEIY